MRHLMRFMLITSALTGALVMTGCNDSSSTNADNNANQPTDEFVAATQNVVATPEATAEAAEPKDIASLTETMPEGTEPVPVTF